MCGRLAARRMAPEKQQALVMHRRLSPYRRLQLRVRQRIPASLREHQGIVDALLAGNGELAACIATRAGECGQGEQNEALK